MGCSWRRIAGAAGAFVFAAAIGAGAQTNSSITGTVSDATGAVLPGVTVEVSSPALIERVRSAVTDGTGQYRIVELSPGAYDVTFTLPGFASVKRSGIALTTNFTATVNAELRVGDVTETITVSGSSPVVDVQNVVQQRVMTRDVIDAVPTAKNFANLGVLIPGTTVTGYGRVLDVGGTEGHGNQMLMIHGGRSSDQRVLLDGMGIGMVDVSGAFPTLAYPDGSAEEINMGLGGHVAEMETGGVRVNIVPKTGSNRFSGSVFGSYTNSSLQSTNLTDEIRAAGLTVVDRTNYISELNPAGGGPLVKDRLWFYLGFRDARTLGWSSLYQDANPADWAYTPDRSRRPGANDQRTDNGTLRLTWQATGRDKFGVNLIYEDRCRCAHAMGGSFEPLTAPEADLEHVYLSTVAQLTWVRPMTNRLLLEAGVSAAPYDFDATPSAGAIGPAALDLNTGYSFRARAAAPGLNEAYYRSKAKNYEMRGSASYVTGAHAFKVGFSANPGMSAKMSRYTLGNYLVDLLNGVPNRVEFFATPYSHGESIAKAALFAQDLWTVRRLTVNAGLRFDWHTSSYDAVTLAATDLLPVRHFDGAEVLNWRDLSPRLGVSYDLFGNGRTALKASANRYVSAETNALTRAVSPAVTSTTRLVRQWIDGNGDFVPQGNPLDPAANGELGPSTNTAWGQPINTLRYADGWARGWNVRGANWEFTAGAQHELLPRVSVNAAYVRRKYVNLAVTDNLATAPADFSEYCITVPSDARLPGGGGQRLCDLFDVNPGRVGALDRLRTLASDYGDQYEYWHGVDLTVDARLASGIILQGGFNTGRVVTDNCDVVTRLDNPSRLYCHQALPALPNVKLLGSYMFPGAIQVAATFQSIPGNPLQAQYVARNAEIAPTLGRNLSAGVNGTATINIVEPGDMLTDRVNQFDVRLARTFTVRGLRIRGMVDFYNIGNANPVLVVNNTYGTNGAAWLTPTQILASRLIKFGAQIDF